MVFYISGPKLLFETTEISTQQESNYIYLYTTKFGTSIKIRLNRVRDNESQLYNQNIFWSGLDIAENFLACHSATTTPSLMFQNTLSLTVLLFVFSVCMDDTQLQMLPLPQRQTTNQRKLVDHRRQETNKQNTCTAIYLVFRSCSLYSTHSTVIQ